MDESQYLVDNIDIAHPNICIARYLLYHMNYLPYHVATLFTCYHARHPSALNYLPLNCSKITIGWSFHGIVIELYNLPPLITCAITWAHHEDGRWYKHNLLLQKRESIKNAITIDYCDIIDKNNIRSMQSHCMQNAIYIS
jgi:hypothetical protein